jgi:hypothetical protein
MGRLRSVDRGGSPARAEPFLLRDCGFTAGDVVGGFRLVRLLGEGSRAAVFLGHASDPSDDAPSAVALKLFREGVPTESIDAEVESLGRHSHDHALRLLDLATTASGAPCLVLERLGARSLNAIIADAAPVRAGEAVTVLAPIALAIDALHAAGVTHGGIRASGVLFRDSGAPVLAGFGRARLSVPGRPGPALRADQRIANDRSCFVTLAGAVLARVWHPEAARLASSLAALAQTADEFGVAVSDALFDFSPAEPVRLEHREAGGARESVPGRAVEARAAGPRVPGLGATEPAAAGAAMTAPDTPRTYASEPGAHDSGAHDSGSPGENPTVPSRARETRLAVRRLRDLAASHLRDVRPRVWAVAASVGLSLVVALEVVPGADDASESSPVGPDRSVPTADSRDTGPAAPDPVAAAVTGDDPVAAVRVLLEVRQRCLRDLDVVCLGAVAQQGSPALEIDERLIREVLAGGELGAGATIRSGDLTLVQRLGDSALVALGAPADSEPASTLVIRGEAGWRIRDYVAP